MEEIESGYDLETERVIKEIKKQKAKRVLLQLPDGLKPQATKLVDELQKQLPSTQFLIWLGSCYGACNIPQVENIKPEIDLIIQFGHSAEPFFTADSSI